MGQPRPSESRRQPPSADDGGAVLKLAQGSPQLAPAAVVERTLMRFALRPALVLPRRSRQQLARLALVERALYLALELRQRSQQLVRLALVERALL